MPAGWGIEVRGGEDNHGVYYFSVFSYGIICFSFVFTWGRMSAVGSGKSADNMCAFYWMCGRQENDLARMGLDSCTLLNASSLRLDEKVILFPTQIPRHGFIIQI
jgi:hypothetical protein